MPATLIEPRRFGDQRGWFTESFNEQRFRAEVADVRFCQDNQSLSRPVGTLRGLHFQTPPHAQAKLVSCVKGAIWDVCVDLRHQSPTYGRWVAAVLSGENGRQLFVPAGFAHGFVTLEPDSHVLYKVDDYYAPECDGGIAWNDPDLALPWPVPAGGPLLSDKDKTLPKLSEFSSAFPYDGRPLRPLPELG